MAPTTGEHVIGTLTMHLTDSSRPEVMTEEEGDYREVVVQVWYPSGEATDTPVVGLIDNVESWAGVYGETASKIGEMGGNAHVGLSPLDGEPLPVLVFSGGRGMSRWQYTGLLTDLASHGWCVVAIDHTHMGRTVLEEGELIGPHPQWDAPRELYTKSPEEIDAFWADMHTYLAQDVAFVLDTLGSLPSDDPLSGRLRLEGVCTIGHSRGTGAAMRSARLDERISRSVGFDALGTPLERGGGLSVPFMNIRSGGDWSHRQVYLDSLYDGVSATMFDVYIEGIDHNACSDASSLGSKSEGRAAAHRTLHGISSMIREFCVGGATDLLSTSDSLVSAGGGLGPIEIREFTPE
ncbi:MAG: alpha/beta hydrolase [Planctomycetota bacterium]